MRRRPPTVAACPELPGIASAPNQPLTGQTIKACSAAAPLCSDDIVYFDLETQKSADEVADGLTFGTCA